MSTLSDVGNLMYLYLDQILPGQGTDAHEFLINATAQKLNKSGGRNWLPIIVREIGEDRYQVIGNFFSFAVAEKAGLEKVWCIIADNSSESEEISQLLSREKIPRINLCKASRDEIKAALEYLLKEPGSPLKGIQLLVAVSRIEQAPRHSWKNLEPISKLKCGITKGKKLDALNKIFYLSPEPLPHPEPLSSGELSRKTVKELRELALSMGLKVPSRLSKSALIQKISGFSKGPEGVT